MSRKDYVAFAKILSAAIAYGSEWALCGSAIARNSAAMFTADSSGFDKERFYKACGLDSNGYVPNPDGDKAADEIIGRIKAGK